MIPVAKVRTEYEIHIESLRTRIGNSYITSREAQVIGLYMEGVERTEIQARLRISSKTIDSCLNMAKARLGAKTVVQLVAMVAKAQVMAQSPSGAA